MSALPDTATATGSVATPLTVPTPVNLTLSAAIAAAQGYSAAAQAAQIATGLLNTQAGTSASNAAASALSASSWASPSALAANAIVVGGGAGAAPSTVTTNSTVLTAIGSAPTGTGSIVLSTSPTLVTPTLGVASATSYTATKTISASGTTGAFDFGTLGFSDTYVFSAFQSNNNGYVQSIIQNTNNGAASSADFVVNNDLGTATTYYGNFGINSSGYTGSGAFNQPSYTYLTATSGDLAIGTTTSNAIHFVVNGGATDAMTISSAGVTSLGTALAIGSGGTGQTTKAAAFNALSPITATGDLIIGNGTNSATNLAIGSNGYVLTSNGTTASWAASSSGAAASSVRQTVQSGPQASSAPSFLPATAASLSLTSQNISTGANTFVVSSANGFGTSGDVNNIGISTSNLTWTSLTASTTNYLFVTVSGGALTTGFTTTLPIYQYGGTISVTSGQYTFDILQMKMFLGNGSTASQVNVVFVGLAVTSGSAVTSTVAYAYNGYYDSGFTATLPANATQTSKNANLGIADFDILMILQNITTEQGYAVGDQIQFTSGVGGIGQTLWGNQLAVGVSVGNVGWAVQPKAGGTSGALTNANWKWKFIAKRKY